MARRRAGRRSAATGGRRGKSAGVGVEFMPQSVAERGACLSRRRGSANLSSMNSARLCLLLLLALLLPLRGALAQVPTCAGGHGAEAAHTSTGQARASLARDRVAGSPGSQPTCWAYLQGHAQGHSNAHPPVHSHGHAPSPDTDLNGLATAGFAAEPGSLHDAKAQGQCSACASCCAGGPAASPLATVLLVQAPAGPVRFPSSASPVASVVLDGLERPPRKF